MRATAEKSGVLKLVHPGGFVEVHYKPITAAQVMKKNPRHCVTRPDVFKFPWIVVRPDSVLKLGAVFFIVPNHTIHRLLHSSGSRRLPRCGLKQKSRVGDERAGKQSVVEQWLELAPGVIESSYESWDDAAPKQRDLGRIKQPSQVGSGDEATHKHVRHSRHPDQLPSVKSSGKVVGKKPTLGVHAKSQCIPASCFSIAPLLQDRNCLHKRSSPIKRCKPETHKLKIRDHRLRKDTPATSVEFSTQSTSGSLVKASASSAKPLNVKNEIISVGLAPPPEQDSGLPKHKPCLRNPGERGRLGSEGLKVTFLLPSEDENKW